MQLNEPANFFLDNFAERSNKSCMYIERHHLEYASRPGGVLINKLN